MFSTSDTPACPHCGSREFRAVHKIRREKLVEKLPDTPVRHPDPDEPIAEIESTVYSCANCRKDLTDVFEALTAYSPPETITEELESKPSDPLDLGIGATIGAGS